jgi:hypothetical protein
MKLTPLKFFGIWVLGFSRPHRLLIRLLPLRVAESIDPLPLPPDAARHADLRKGNFESPAARVLHIGIAAAHRQHANLRAARQSLRQVPVWAPPFVFYKLRIKIGRGGKRLP